MLSLLPQVTVGGTALSVTNPWLFLERGSFFFILFFFFLIFFFPFFFFIFSFKIFCVASRRRFFFFFPPLSSLNGNWDKDVTLWGLEGSVSEGARGCG